MRRLWHSAVVAGSLAATLVLGEAYTPKHEAGRCAIRGGCGKQGFFGPDLPCPDNGLAREPEDAVRKQLVEMCGPKWSTGPVCCEGDQLNTLSDNLKKANAFISSCPACKDNFYNMFCTFTCSPDQSLFINVTQAEKKKDKYMVTELDQLISDEYGSGFYDSCKDVKFGPTNSNSMTFIGGGAKNYTAFLAFLGKKNPPFGSPFQINFPRPADYPERGLGPLDMAPKSCNDEDEAFRCACVDCSSVCPKLPEVTEAHSCHVGVLPCLSFGAILTYGVFLTLLATAVSGHTAWAKHARRKSERLRLLQDAAPSDDEDEEDMIHNNAMYDRPQKSYFINTVCDSAFGRLGYIAAKFPAITISISILFVGILSLGWLRFEIETNPARLWVSPTSAAAQEKAFFDKNFGPFYRTEQVFLINDTNPEGPGPVLSYETLKWWIEVEDRVSRLTGESTGASLDDVCFNPTGDACVVQSVAAYFGNDDKKVRPATWKGKLQSCVDSPVNCLPKFHQPIDPKLVLGGNKDSDDAADSPAIIITWVLNNAAEDSAEVARAMDWEASLKSMLLGLETEAKDRGLRLSFNTEISLEEELNKSTNTDAKIIVISYVIMFFYASLALGSTTLSLRSMFGHPARFLVESKFSLGVIGILIVLMSISASVGLFSFAGIKVTLIIAEVIPFIVLAVGVDNIFLIVHEFERVNISHPDDTVEYRIAKALGRMGPSILLSATTETIAFALGAFVGMPAVRNFAIYAAGAVFINALLQVTMFVSVLALNQRRVEDHRADCFPCIRLKSAGIQLGQSNRNEYVRSYEGHEEGRLQQFIRKSYAPALLGKKMKAAIVVIFLGIFAAAVSLMPRIALGLDQRVAIPDGSYLIPYFNDLYDYFESGPPVYFVTRELNVTERIHQQQLCSRFTTCQQESLTNVLEQERKRPDVSYIASTPANWIDDYFRWLDPQLESCCVENGKPCFSERDPAWNITLSGMPEGGEFIHYLRKWVSSPTDEDCPLGGQASYADALVIDSDRETIPASHFRSSHTPLRSQEDFIAAYASARRISDGLKESTGIEVFPYSVFYIFFNQYSTIVRLTATLLGSALAMILVISSILLGSVKTGIIVTITVIMIVVDIIGTMAVFNVSLNAVSLVNLVICVGIGVEFCAHIARAFMFPSRTVMQRVKNKFRGRDARVWTALVNVGGSVFSGITITKLLGVFVLAFTRSKIFEIYYFRIWLALVVFAATHALVFLPVVLSLFGGEGYVDPESDGGLEEDLTSRRRALLLDDDDSDYDY
ncbi:Multidrug efflux transporter AcrB transmembrane-containing protein [Venustampulla echinocandica]|uniref:Multidrug efflux transporter AcrB transmembrane-containing protein n=1 Tax=Venustampulla echinocandica TaxID=2656787 RepID=A0A370TLW0_9HELO|nr:Multidrug efflux transporter AcrB transmembrane-containing protein [Venustampulla echinocandica]RDL36510.1 Multidrug efflux transporter AcrB transmembrane-containing protein [Venustampulla echinocandica]